MNKLLNPRSVFIANTLPQALLLLAFYSQYTLIQSQLDYKSISLWAMLGGALVILFGGNLLWGVVLTLKRKPLPLLYGILTLITYTLYLFAYYFNVDHLLPWSIPRWVLSEDSEFYAITLIMPAIAHAVLMLVAIVTDKDKDPSALKSFLGAIAIPFIYFALIVLPGRWIPFYNWPGGKIIFLILLALGTVGFFFLLVRTMYILALKREETLKKYSLFWKIPFTILLPLLGLAVNNGLIIKDGFFRELFGDYRHPLFYILAVVTGILLCIPSRQNKGYRLLLFIGRCITLAYTTYFFLVFLPYLPFSIAAIAAVGLGFLMLAPLILMVIHAADLSNDYSFLKQHFSPALLIAAAILGFMVLPAAVTCNNLHTRSVLHKSLDYLYNTDYNQNYRADTSALSAALNAIDEEQRGSRGNFMNRKLPYLSSYFNWLVLDNMTLPENKANMLKAVYLGKGDVAYSESMVTGNPKITITDLKHNSTYDTKQNTWISTIDLSITNTDPQLWQGEYATTIELPAGCWISDYYLYTDSTHKEHGILAEKGAAMWIYNQIRTIERRDPGLLYYLTGNKVAFHVFPFTREQTRYTGIEFLHKEPVTLTLDGRNVALGDSTKQATPQIEKASNDAVVYIPAAQKHKLPKVTRKPYYHFIVDVSAGKENRKEEYISRIEKELNSSRLDKAHATVSFVNAGINTFDVYPGLRENYNQQEFESGFYLDRAIRNILHNAYTTPTDIYPVIIVVSDSTSSSIIEKDFCDFKAAYPESDLFYYLNTNGKPEAHLLTYFPLQSFGNADTLKHEPYVLAYPDTINPVAYLRDNGQPDIITTGLANEPNTNSMTEKNWASALAIQGDWQMRVLHPCLNEKRWKNSVAASFSTKVMTPVTSYIVVENEMQKEALKRKQEQVLNAKKALGEADMPKNNNDGAGAPIDGGIFVLIAALMAYSYKTLRGKKEKHV